MIYVKKILYKVRIVCVYWRISEQQMTACPLELRVKQTILPLSSAAGE
jgi:hypothetical protein